MEKNELLEIIETQNKLIKSLKENSALKSQIIEAQGKTIIALKGNVAALEKMLNKA